MHTERPLLPDFKQPPVAEVVLGLQFKPLENFRVAHVGLLWERYRERYPAVEDHPPLPSSIEQPPGQPRGGVELRFEMSEGLPMARSWFLSPDRTALIQVQRDRFVHNWRKVVGDETYPRYERLLESFHSEFVVFTDFLAQEQLGEVLTEQCEVSYVNHIVAGPDQGWEHHSDVGQVLSMWSPTYSDPHSLAAPEDIRLIERHVLTADDGSFLGRLLITVDPVWYGPEPRPGFILNLVARGAPLSHGVQGAYDFFALGRAAIVSGFASVTTERMHKIWGRADGRFAH